MEELDQLLDLTPEERAQLAEEEKLGGKEEMSILSVTAGEG